MPKDDVGIAQDLVGPENHVKTRTALTFATFDSSRAAYAVLRYRKVLPLEHEGFHREQLIGAVALQL